MSRQNRTLLLWIVFIIIVIGGVIAFASYTSNQPSELDDFAMCLGEKEAVFYGAFWCSHCADQKRLFGRSVSKLPYVECSTPDGNGQLPVCSEANVTAYPTWEFSDGSREVRVISLQELSERTGCELP